MYSNEWGGLQARRWQADALAAIESRDDDRGLVVAVMGAGKSVLLAELCARTDGRVIRFRLNFANSRVSVSDCTAGFEGMEACPAPDPPSAGFRRSDGPGA